ncbi:glutamate--cysteine ligase, chloroplastic, partial [Tanacetum coccineum]
MMFSELMSLSEFNSSVSQTRDELIREYLQKRRLNLLRKFSSASSTFTLLNSHYSVSVLMAFLLSDYYILEVIMTLKNIILSAKFGQTPITIVLGCSLLSLTTLLAYIDTSTPLSCGLIFEQYVEYALDVPYPERITFIFTGLPHGEIAPISGDYPTLNDWENHLTTIFLEMRLKRYLEMRGADGGPWRRLCALTAFR